MILLYCYLFTVSPYFTVLFYCGKRLLSLHNFFLMRSHDGISVLHVCDYHVIQLHGCTFASKRDLRKTSNFTNITIDIHILGLWESSIFHIFENVQEAENQVAITNQIQLSLIHFYFKFIIVQYWLLAAIIHYLIISFIYTYIYLYPYIFILFCSNFLAFSILIF